MTRPTPTEGPMGAAVGVVAFSSFRPPTPGTLKAATGGGSSGRRIG